MKIRGETVYWAVIQNAIWPCLMTVESSHIRSTEKTVTIEVLNQFGEIAHSYTIPRSDLFSTLDLAINELKIARISPFIELCKSADKKKKESAKGK